MDIETWWNIVKESPMWSGAIVSLSWDELWDEAKKELNTIYNKANNALDQTARSERQ